MHSGSSFDAATVVDDPMVATFAGLRRALAGDVSVLPVDVLNELSVDLRSVRSFVDGASARVLAAIAKVGGATEQANTLRGDRGSVHEIRRRRDTAIGVGLAPLFGPAVESGAITADHAAALAKVRNPGQVADVEGTLLALANRSTPEEFARGLAAWDDTVEGDNGASADAARWAKRRVTFGRSDDGMGFTNAVVPLVEQTMIENAIEHVAEQRWRNGDRSTTTAQRRADALLEIFARAMGHPSPTPNQPAVERADSSRPVSTADHLSPPAPVRPNRPSSARPSMIVLIDEGSLFGRLDAAGISRTVDGAPVTVSEARRLACFADIIPVVHSGNGRVLDVGRKHRLVTDTQWWALVARDPGCVVAECTAPLTHTEAHHCLEWETGGRTDLDNLCLLCARHHRELHQNGWRARIDANTVHITDKNGRTVPTKRPPPRREYPE